MIILTNNNLDVLIGSQILTMTNDKIVVAKDGTNYTLYIGDYSDDCCGFNEIQTVLNYGENRADNPIITNIVREIDNDDRSRYDGSSCKVTFYGDSKVIGTIDAYSSSGSGWEYGAYVTVECKALGIDETLSAW